MILCVVLLDAVYSTCSGLSPVTKKRRQRAGPNHCQVRLYGGQGRYPRGSEKQRIYKGQEACNGLLRLADGYETRERQTRRGGKKTKAGGQKGAYNGR